MSASGRAAPITSPIASRPPERSEIVRVLPVGQERELERLARLDVRQREIDRAVGRAPARAVAVEAEHRLVGHLPQQRELIFGERRAERRDGRLIARRHHRDHVDIALDHDDGAPSCAACRAAAPL